MNTNDIINEVKKVADYLEAQNIYNDGEAAFEAALKIVMIEIDILKNADHIVGNIKWLKQAESEITLRQDV